MDSQSQSQLGEFLTKKRHKITAAVQWIRRALESIRVVLRELPPKKTVLYLMVVLLAITAILLLATFLHIFSAVVAVIHPAILVLFSLVTFTGLAFALLILKLRIENEESAERFRRERLEGWSRRGLIR